MMSYSEWVEKHREWLEENAPEGEWRERYNNYCAEVRAVVEGGWYA